ncbi:unnamed protein product [Brassica rapa subsp. trilocularis]
MCCFLSSAAPATMLSSCSVNVSGLVISILGVIQLLLALAHSILAPQTTCLMVLRFMVIRYKDAFKTIKAYVKNFISVIKSEILRSKGEESSCTTRALEDWESCGYSLMKTLIIKEICDYTVDLERFIKLNISAMHQVWNHRSKKNNGERISERKQDFNEFKNTLILSILRLFKIFVPLNNFSSWFYYVFLC